MMKWEIHMHTSEGSRCGKIEAAEGVRMYKEAGYTGVVITDHFNNTNVDSREGTTEEKLRSWLAGYESAKAEGERIGVRVLFGLEPRLQDCDNDYLIYGADPSIVLENPSLNHITLPELHALCERYGALLIQAHPNRKGCHPVYAGDLDGVEVYNSNPRHENYNEDTLAWAESETRLIRTSGSDFHRVTDLAGGGILTERDIYTEKDLADCLRSGDYTLIRGERAE